LTRVRRQVRHPSISAPLSSARPLEAAAASAPPVALSDSYAPASGPSSRTAPVAPTKSKPVKTSLIHFNPATSTFTLAGKNMEYVLNISPTGELVHRYWGAPVGELAPEPLSIHDYPYQGLLQELPREYPDLGRGDEKTPAISLTTAEGLTTSQFKYVSHRIVEGKPGLDGLPGLTLRADQQAQAQTLLVTLRDELAKVDLELSYTVFKDSDVVARSARLTNRGSAPVSIEKLASFSADFEPNDYRLLKLSGFGQRETHEKIVDLDSGNFSVFSRGGRSHTHNPFIALLDKNTDEHQGDAYGFSLVYSGPFLAEAEQDGKQNTRVVTGMNPSNFRWKLKPGETFQSPEAIGVFSSSGLSGLTRQLHAVFRDKLNPSPWNDKLRPVYLNTWEGSHFDLSHDKILEMAHEAKKLGVELIVVDDGWFGDKYPRNDDTQGLGDWVANPAKLPKGVSGLGKEINALGLKFGIWVEPEMVSPRSELYEKHPDWVISQPGRDRTQLRNQLVLDLGRPEVQEFIIESMSKLLDSGNIQFLRWDMNRTLTEVGSAALSPDEQRETQHRYMLGLYRVLEVITTKYPEVLFEGSTSGGGRYDPGMLRYFAQMNTSDNNDPISRLEIQAGTARVYPVQTLESQVTESPQPQTQRVVSLKTRFISAMAANLGLGIDPTRLSDDEKAYFAKEIAEYKEIRPLVQRGEYLPLNRPAETNWPASMYVAHDGADAVVFAFQRLSEARTKAPRLRLEGLDPQAVYSVTGIGSPVSGAYLMRVGLELSFEGDFDSQMFRIHRLSQQGGFDLVQDVQGATETGLDP
jgi:alpha-galactosidase